MRAVNIFYKNIVLFILWALIFIPIAISNIIDVNELTIYGDFIPRERPVFNRESYVSGEFQTKYAGFFNDSLPFRSYVLKFHHQLLFSIFDEAIVDGAVVGKDGMLFQKDYLNEYNGKSFVGDSLIQLRTRRFKFLQTELEKRGKHLLVLFAPGKASYYNELIPWQYKKKIGISNYDAMTNLFDKHEINYIDFRDYFMTMKDSSTYPLFGKTGIHWSNYAMHLATDSLIRRMESMSGKKLPKKIYSSLEITDTARFGDNDLSYSLNLLFPLKDFKFAYPQYIFKVSEKTSKPNVLVVGDSYWKSAHVAFIPYGQFNDYHYLYYNNSIYTKKAKEDFVITPTLINEYVQNSDFVILISTEINYHWFPFGFDEDLEKVFSPEFETKNAIFEKAVSTKIIQIRKDKRWMKEIGEKAVKHEMTFDQQLRKDAVYVLTLNK